MPARVAIVIPTWNRSEMLARALESLQGQSYPVDQVMVVDNGSTDDASGAARRAGAQVISFGSNAGFAAAVNRGIREAGGADYIGVLNNDVTLDANWLSHVISKLESSAAWFAAGKLLDARARDRIDGSFDAICRGGCASRCGHGRPDSAVWNQGRTIQLAPLTAAVFRAGVFERVGLLDERFESYLEDVDFGLRCGKRAWTACTFPRRWLIMRAAERWDAGIRRR